jgi:tubulin-specific chaperone B
MSMQTARDISLRIVSANAAGERRLSPSWTLAQLKTKLEPVTGIPPSCQKLMLRVPGRDEVEMQALNEDAVQIGGWNLVAGGEIEVSGFFFSLFFWLLSLFLVDTPPPPFFFYFYFSFSPFF